MLLSFFLLALLPAVAVCSENGNYYACDTQKLASENLCYFVATPSNPFGTASPHVWSDSVAADGFRKVVDGTGKDLTVSPKPWTQGDTLAASTTRLSDDLSNYAKVFELVAPLRNAMMYSPKTVSGSQAEWDRLTKAFVDCKIKDKDETFTTPGGTQGTAYSVSSVYGILKDPKGQDTHHGILQFLEEGAIDLVCLATSLAMNRCDTIRAHVGVTGTSTCWNAAYAAHQTSSSSSPSPSTTANPTASVTANPTASVTANPTPKATPGATTTNANTTEGSAAARRQVSPRAIVVVCMAALAVAALA